MDSKRKKLRVSFAFFLKNYLPHGRMKVTVGTVEKLSDLWKPGAMDVVPPFVMICSLVAAICFSCSISFACWCDIRCLS